MKELLRLTVVTAVAVLATTLLAASASAQGKPSYGCPPSFDFYVTTQEAAELPRSQAAIDDGLISEADLIAVYQTRFDKNGNNMLCVQEVPGWVPERAEKRAEYFYNFIDDSSSSPN